MWQERDAGWRGTRCKSWSRNKQEFVSALNEVRLFTSQKKFDEAQAAVDKALALPDLAAEQVHEGLFYKGLCYQQMKDLTRALACYRSAVAAAPEGRYAGTIKILMEQAEKNAKKAAPEKKDVSKAE